MFIAYHSFLTRGFSQHPVLFEAAFVDGYFEGAARAQEAEARTQTVADVKRILRLADSSWKGDEKVIADLCFLHFLIGSLCTRAMHHMHPSRLCESRDGLRTILYPKVWLW